MGFGEPNSRYWQGCAPSRGFRGKSISFSLQLVVTTAFFSSWPFLHLKASSVTSSSIFLLFWLICLSLIRTLVIMLGLPKPYRSSPHLKILNIITPKKSLLPSLYIYRFLGLGYEHLQSYILPTTISNTQASILFCAQGTVFSHLISAMLGHSTSLSSKVQMK